MSTNEARPLLFVDAAGGALAAMGASIARSLGHADAIAATTEEARALPDEAITALDEIGLEAASVTPLDPSIVAAHVVVWLGDPSAPSTVTHALHVPCKLLASDAGALERIATARIARDRIERAVQTKLRR